MHIWTCWRVFNSGAHQKLQVQPSIPFQFKSKYHAYFLPRPLYSFDLTYEICGIVPLFQIQQPPGETPTDHMLHDTAWCKWCIERLQIVHLLRAVLIIHLRTNESTACSFYPLQASKISPKNQLRNTGHRVWGYKCVISKSINRGGEGKRLAKANSEK